MFALARAWGYKCDFWRPHTQSNLRGTRAGREKPKGFGMVGGGGNNSFLSTVLTRYHQALADGDGNGSGRKGAQSNDTHAQGAGLPSGNAIFDPKDRQKLINFFCNRLYPLAEAAAFQMSCVHAVDELMPDLRAMDISSHAVTISILNQRLALAENLNNFVQGFHQQVASLIMHTENLQSLSGGAADNTQQSEALSQSNQSLIYAVICVLIQRLINEARPESLWCKHDTRESSTLQQYNELVSKL